jgi:hypothetical protein
MVDEVEQAVDESSSFRKIVWPKFASSCFAHSVKGLYFFEC